MSENGLAVCRDGRLRAADRAFLFVLAGWVEVLLSQKR
jgi:hypothetical protein